MLLLLLNYVVLRALWKIDEHLISTLVNKSLYYYYCAPATQRQTFCAKLHTAQNLKIHLGRYCGPVCIQKHFDHFDHFCIEFWPQLQYNGTSFSSPGSEHAHFPSIGYTTCRYWHVTRKMRESCVYICHDGTVSTMTDRHVIYWRSWICTPNHLRSDLPWQAEYISANVSRFYKILVKCTYALDFALNRQIFFLLLNYFLDISRDWERLQGTTTLHGRLMYAVENDVYLHDVIWRDAYKLRNNDVVS